MAICAGSSFLVALFHQTHLQTIRSVNRENLIACKCAIEASATPGLYHSSQVSHSWDSLRSSETGVSFWAQRNLYIKGHTCSCCCCCCFFFFFFCVLVKTAKFQLWQFPRTICTSLKTFRVISLSVPFVDNLRQKMSVFIDSRLVT